MGNLRTLIHTNVGRLPLIRPSFGKVNPPYWGDKLPVRLVDRGGAIKDVRFSGHWVRDQPGVLRCRPSRLKCQYRKRGPISKRKWRQCLGIPISTGSKCALLGLALKVAVYSYSDEAWDDDELL